MGWRRSVVQGGIGIPRTLVGAAVAAWLLSGCGGDAPGAPGQAPMEKSQEEGPPDEPAGAVGPAVRLTGTVLPRDPRPYNAFGTRTVLSDDGRTLVVSGHADPLNPLTGRVEVPHRSWGAVHVFRRGSHGAWQPVTTLRPLVGPDDGFGSEIALSGDGRTLAVGAMEDSGRARGIGGDPHDRVPRPGSGVVHGLTGAVWVYALRDSGWMLQEYIKASNPGEGDLFGRSVALSRNGDWMAVGALNESSRARGIDGGQCNDCAPSSGAVYVFQRDARGRWRQREFVKASNADARDQFGIAVALSGDGRVLAVGANGEASAASRVEGDPADNSQPLAGAVYVFERGRSGGLVQGAYLKARVEQGPNMFGFALSLSAAGDVLAVGARDEAADPVSTSIQPWPGRYGVGRVYVFSRRAGSPRWMPPAVLSASNAGMADRFGTDVKLSGDGRTLAVGAPEEDGGIPGVDAPQHDDSAQDAGAIYVFRITRAGLWRQRAYVKTPTTRQYGYVGYIDAGGLGLSAAGDTLVVGDREGNTYCAGCAGGGGSAFVYRVR
jgi:hypothetical protein